MFGGKFLVEPGADGGGRKRLVRRGVDAGQLEGFAFVGRDQIESVKRERVAGLGVEGDEFAGGASETGNPGDEGVGEDAFGVVRENDGVVAGDGGAKEFFGVVGGDRVGGGRGLAIEAAELLALDETAGFDDRLGVAGGGEGGDFSQRAWPSGLDRLRRRRSSRRR